MIAGAGIRRRRPCCRRRWSLPSFAIGFVAADVILMDVGVDDVADRLVGELANRRDDLRTRLLGTSVSTSSTPSSPTCSRDVAAGADEHVHVALHVQDVDLDVVEILSLGCRTDGVGDTPRGWRPAASAASVTRSAWTSRYAAPVPDTPTAVWSSPGPAAPAMSTGTPDTSFPRRRGRLRPGMPYFAGNSPRNVFVPGR